MRGSKILIVGAGAIGGYFGASLYRAGLDVTFLVRPKTYVRMAKDGLSVKSPAGDFTVHPPVIRTVSEIASVDLVILAVKCYDLAAVITQVAPLVEAGATLMTLQNGVDSEERIRSYFDKDCVVAGVAYITARLAGPGVIEHFKRGTISLGELSGERSERAKRIFDLISHAGITCHLTHQIQKEKWEKLCWNATFNPLSVILDHTISLILKSDHLLEIVRQGVQEVAAVAAAEGFRLHPEIVNDTISASHALQDYHTSMYEDYQHGRPTEIEHLNGDLIRRGERWGVPTPTHQTLYCLVKGLELRAAQGHGPNERTGPAGPVERR